MNKLRFLLILIALSSVVVWQACGGDAAQNAAQEETTQTEEATSQDDKSGPEYTSAYVCPMHCKGSGSNSPGKCPVCGMAYVANPNHPMHQQGAMQKEEMGQMHQNDDAGHEGHNH